MGEAQTGTKPAQGVIFEFVKGRFLMLRFAGRFVLTRHIMFSRARAPSLRCLVYLPKGLAEILRIEGQADGRPLIAGLGLLNIQLRVKRISRVAPFEVSAWMYRAHAVALTPPT